MALHDNPLDPEHSMIERIRTELIGHVERHKAVCKDPNCADVGNLLAYLAHCLGASDRDMREMQRIFLMYETECKNSGGCAVHMVAS